MSRRSVKASIIGLSASAALILSTLPGSANTLDPTPEYPTQVSIEELGVDAEVNASGDWRIEVHEDGSTTVVFGPGTAGQGFNEDTVKFTGTEPSKTGMGQAGWSCTSENIPKPYEVGSSLQSWLGASCTGDRPGSMRFRYEFDRDSWSGWRDFTETRYFSWTTSQYQASDIYAHCYSPGGTYDYRVRAVLEVKNAGAYTGHWGTSPDGRETCGTGIS